uniref:hypothetical protein n=1 Tax=Phocaeicola sartorii TaxID=671267 RepID=UPI0025891322
HIAKVRTLVKSANKTTKKVCFLTCFKTFILFVKGKSLFYLPVFHLFAYKTVYLLPLLQKDKNEWFQ